MAARRRTALMYGSPSAGRPARSSASAAIRYVSASRNRRKSREPRVSLTLNRNGSWNLFSDGKIRLLYVLGVYTRYGLANAVSASVVETYTAVSPSRNLSAPLASRGIVVMLLAYHTRVNWASYRESLVRAYRPRKNVVGRNRLNGRPLA